jgi:uncharacterized membrane protein YvlD (DUF360 family)
MILKLILIKLVVNAALLYGLALLCGGRIRFGGIIPVLSVAIFLVPINVFILDIHEMAGLPEKAGYVFLSSVALNGVILYLLSYIIPRFTVETLGTALAFSTILGIVSVFLNFFLADQIVGLL